MNFSVMGVLVPATAFLLSIVILLIMRSIAFRLLRRWAEREDTRLDTIVVDALRTPSLYWCLAIGLYIAITVSQLPERYIFYISKTIVVLVILSITLAIGNLSGKILNTFGRSSLSIQTTGIANAILKITILIMGALVALSILNIPIAPLITALGVGGLAIALALQDTLANLFAGIYLLVEKSIRVGDVIRLETAQEGFVEDISWRTTRIRMLPNTMIIIPNSKLSQSVVTNYCLPGKQLAVSIPVRVNYAADPEQVERILTEEAKQAITEIPGLLGDPEPVVRFIPGFGENSLDFTLTCQVREFADQGRVQHELRKKLFYRLKNEGIGLAGTTATGKS